jgi:hypothetical protein
LRKPYLPSPTTLCPAAQNDLENLNDSKPCIRCLSSACCRHAGAVAGYSASVLHKSVSQSSCAPTSPECLRYSLRFSNVARCSVYPVHTVQVASTHVSIHRRPDTYRMPLFICKLGTSSSSCCRTFPCGRAGLLLAKQPLQQRGMDSSMECTWCRGESNKIYEVIC